MNESEMLRKREEELITEIQADTERGNLVQAQELQEELSSVREQIYALFTKEASIQIKNSKKEE